MYFGMKVRAAQDGPEVPDLHQEVANNIQHLCVRVKATGGRFPYIWSIVDLDTLKQLGGPKIRRKSCQILLEMTLENDALIDDELLIALKTLVGFEALELRFVSSAGVRSACCSKSQGNLISHQQKDAYILCAKALSPSLGPGVMGQDSEGHFIRFNPRRLK